MQVAVFSVAPSSQSLRLRFGCSLGLCTGQEMVRSFFVLDSRFQDIFTELMVRIMSIVLGVYLKHHSSF